MGTLLFTTGGGSIHPVPGFGNVNATAGALRRRYPSMTLNLLLTPVVLLLLFVYIFGDTMSAGLGGGGGGRSEYLRYLVPGILMLTIGGTTIGTAVSVSTDMTEGIIACFRTMAIHRGSVLIGHVIGSVLQCVLSVVLV